MAGNWGAILAGLAGGAGSLAQSMDRNEREAARKAELDRAWKRLTDNDKTVAEDRDEDRAEKRRAAEQATRDRAMALSEKGLADLTGRYEKAGVKVIDPEVMQFITGSRLMPQVTTPDAGPAGLAASISNMAIQGGKGVGVGLQSEALKALAQSTEQKGANVPVSIGGRQIGFAQDPSAAKKAEAEQAHRWRVQESAASRAAAPPRGSVVTVKRNGEDVTGWYNPDTKEFNEIGGAKGGAGGFGQARIHQIIADNNKRIGTIDLALKAVNDRPQSFGLEFAMGILPGLGTIADQVNQRNDPEGVAARSLVANIASLEIKDRSGAAVTVSEFPRLTPFIPQVGDTPEKIITNLQQLRQIIELHNAALARGDVDSPDVLTTDSSPGLPASIAGPRAGNAPNAAPASGTFTFGGKTYKLSPDQ